MCDGNFFYVIGVSIAATREGSSGLNLRRISPRKRVQDKGKQVSTAEGIEWLHVNVSQK